MSNPWCTGVFARSQIIPWNDVQITVNEMTAAVVKAQGYIASKILYPIAQRAQELADTTAGIPDSAPLKVATAIMACYFAARSKYMGLGPNKNEWIPDLKKDADDMVKEFRNNATKALSGSSLSEEQMTAMGLESSKRNINPAASMLDERGQQIDPRLLQDEADKRNIP